MQLLVLYIGIASLFSSVEATCRKVSFTKKTSNVKHDVFKLRDTTVSHLSICSRLCYDDLDCRSLQYNTNTGLCTTHNVSLDLVPDNEATPDPGNAVYYKDSGPKDCWSIFATNSSSPDGVYSIEPAVGSGIINVYCDMTSDGGGWTVLQRRTDGSEDFYRDWNNYKAGFGNLSNEFWLGNDNIYRITNQRDYIIQFDLEDFSNDRRVASYSQFFVEDESHFYRLHISGYSGDAGDSMFEIHNSRHFTTRDRDNDRATYNCAQRFHGGWWYLLCHSANLNGEYGNNNFGEGINWKSFKGFEYSLKCTAMKIRPK